MRLRRLTLLVLCLSLLTAHAATDYRFARLTSEQGLPHQQVETMAQDHKGNIWIGTRNGLVRYDGYQMHCYYHDEHNPNSLTNNFIKVLRCDSRGRIWACTEAGISRYRPETDDFATYHGSTEHVLSLVETATGRIIGGGQHLNVYDERVDSFIQYPSLEIGFIVSMTVDSHDNLYVASNNSIYSYDASLTKITRLDPAYYQDFTTGIDGIMPMYFDHAGQLWLGRNGQGVMRIDLGSGQTRIYPPDEISNGIVRTITEDSLHCIWLGTEKGLTVIHPDGRIELIQHRFQAPHLLSDNAIYCILNDAHGNLWIGSYFGGVDILLRHNTNFLWTQPGYGPQNVRGKVIRQMAEVAPDHYWIATEDAGINICNTQTGLVEPFTALPDMGTNVHSLHYDPATADIWIGTFRHGLFRYNLRTHASRRYLMTNGLNSDAIFDIVADSRQRLWMATTQGLRRYDPLTDTFLPTDNDLLNHIFVYTLCADRQGNLWAGTSNAGLFRISSDGHHISRWTKQPGGLRDNYVTCLLHDSHGTLWIGTNNSGLQYMAPADRQPRTLDVDAQLLNSTICSLSEDAGGDLWIATGQGLYRYSPATRAVRRFTTQDGLPTNQFNFAAALTDSRGLTMLGTVNGLVTFDPAQLHISRATPDVHWSLLSINNEPVTTRTDHSPLTRELDLTDTITLSYAQARSFTIDYGVILPGMNGSVEYQRWVEGIDRHWRPVGSERRFNGYNLRPGTYRLHVRANASGDGWDDCPERRLTILVRPPFYRSAWACLLYALLSAALAYIAWRIVNERMRSRNEVRIAKLEKAKLEEIDRAKFDFFTTVSHELKTPLALIVAPLRTISRQELTGQNRENLSLALKNTQKMEALISELVTFNKLETDQFPFYVQHGNPLTFIEQAACAFREACTGKGITLDVATEDNGEEVWFSPDYLERILNNLLSNALKFTAEGGDIRIRASIEADAQQPSATHLRFSVADTGIGIAPEELGNIFTRYYQTKRGHNVNSSGWGIGLALVKRLCDVHKGTITVESQMGRGTTFTCLLSVSASAFAPECLIRDDKEIVPVSQYAFLRGYERTEARFNADSPDAEADTDNTVPAPPPPPRQETLLLVDDNCDLLSFLSNYLTRHGYQVLTAENGLQALDIVRQRQDVDMIISDVMMPEMDGTELCRTLKTTMETSHLPVILLTAKSESADVVAGYRCGAEAYVAKPFDPEVLTLQVNNILQLQKARQHEVVTATHDADIDATSLTELDKQFIRRITDLVDHNLANSDFSVADITAALGISRSLLHTKMKSLMGLPVGDFIRNKRLQRAQQMLRDGYNVSETAYATGFSDPNYFSKTFKKHVGINPSEIRK